MVYYSFPIVMDTQISFFVVMTHSYSLCGSFSKMSTILCLFFYKLIIFTVTYFKDSFLPIVAWVQKVKFEIN